VRLLTFDKGWEYFKYSSIRHIDEQRRGITSTYTEVTPTFIFEEWERLAGLLCQNRDVTEMSEHEVYENRLSALRDIIPLLAVVEPLARPLDRPMRRLRMRRLRRRRVRMRIQICPGTQCLFCVGEASLCYSARTFRHVNVLETGEEP
jgi:hypothetical protein